MDKLKNYIIPLSGLKIGEHKFSFLINKEFFESFKVEQEFTDAEINVKVILEKSSNLMNLNLKIKGNLYLNCDISTLPYWQKVKNKMKLVVKYGDKFDDTEDEIITIPFNEHQIDFSQLIYETVLLSVPMKKIHPDILSGKNNEFNKLLETFEPTEKIKEQEYDPRWENLKSIKK